MNDLTAYEEVVQLYTENNIFERAIFFLMNNQSGFETNFPKMGTNMAEPNLRNVVEILANILFCINYMFIYKKLVLLLVLVICRNTLFTIVSKNKIA